MNGATPIFLISKGDIIKSLSLLIVCNLYHLLIKWQTLLNCQSHQLLTTLSNQLQGMTNKLGMVIGLHLGVT
jgi:hypothetical protein